jgi:hypothetical protein
MHPSGQALEGVQMPCSVIQINIEDVRTSEQHCPDARSIKYSTRRWISEVDTVWEVSARLPDDVETVSFECEKDFSEDRPDARSSRLEVNPIKIELRCF